MSTSLKKIAYLALPLLSKIFLLVLTGGIFLSITAATIKDPLEDEGFKTDWSVFTQAFVNLEPYMPPSVQYRDLVFGGIRGMLDTLDPHTHFLDPDAYNFMLEEQDGSFYGIGISFDISPDGYLRVVAPIEGTPAAKLGIRAGDRIVKIDGVSTKNITEVEVIRKLRGKEGSIVVITIEREGSDQSKDYPISREKIPVFTVRDPYMIRPGVGYLKITQFSRPTVEQFQQALEKLNDQGLKQLIIDLRGNPGGLLDQAVDLVGIFIEKGSTIVLTDGRIPASRNEFVARTDEKFPDLPIIVLVNSASASASEIVAGAFQDLDRALVVGTRTYGKGLVQRQYPLPLDTAIQITTAKYYTPSKRCIQRSYLTPHERYFQKLSSGKSTPESDKKYFSRGGRPLQGGGGILPDVVVEQKVPTIVVQLFARDAFFEFAINYSSKVATIPKNFEVDDKVFDEFRTFASAKVPELKPEEWVAQKKQIKIWIKQEIVSAYFGLDEKLKVANEHDHQLQTAIELLGQAETLLKTYKTADRKTSAAE